MTITFALVAFLISCTGPATQPKPAAEPTTEQDVMQQIEALNDGRPLSNPTLANPTLANPSATPEPAEPDAQLGTVITVTGTARNAKMGAVVVTDNGPYYLQGMQEWSEEFDGKQVSVAGTLSSAKLAPDPVPTAKGEQNPGMFGRSQVLANAQVTLVEATPPTP